MVSLRNSIIEEARHRLEAVVEDYLDKSNQDREEKISRTSCDLVGVHVRRRDHIKYEERLGLDTLTRQTGEESSPTLQLERRRGRVKNENIREKN